MHSPVALDRIQSIRLADVATSGQAGPCVPPLTLDRIRVLPTPAPPWLVVRSTTSSTAAQGVEPWWKCLHCEQFWTVGLRRTVFNRVASRLPRHRGRTPGLPPISPPTRGPHFLLALNLGNLARRFLGLLIVTSAPVGSVAPKRRMIWIGTPSLLHLCCRFSSLAL